MVGCFRSFKVILVLPKKKKNVIPVGTKKEEVFLLKLRNETMTWFCCDFKSVWTIICALFQSLYGIILLRLGLAKMLNVERFITYSDSCNDEMFECKMLQSVTNAKWWNLQSFHSERSITYSKCCNDEMFRCKMLQFVANFNCKICNLSVQPFDGHERIFSLHVGEWRREI